jgi:hypothetical protein
MHHVLHLAQLLMALFYIDRLQFNPFYARNECHNAAISYRRAELRCKLPCNADFWIFLGGRGCFGYNVFLEGGGGAGGDRASLSGLASSGPDSGWIGIGAGVLSRAVGSEPDEGSDSTEAGWGRVGPGGAGWVRAESGGAGAAGQGQPGRGWWGPGSRWGQGSQWHCGVRWAPSDRSPLLSDAQLLGLLCEGYLCEGAGAQPVDQRHPAVSLPRRR